ncbi:MAG: glycosyltransferase family 2 protein [Alphaproteobacteria bacterium]
MTIPILAITIPTFNRAEHIGALLHSLIPQGQQLAIHICDNASTDDTVKIAQQYAQHFAVFTYHIHPENIGAPLNFLAAASMVQSPYSLICGSDDVLLAEFIPSVLALLQTLPAPDIIYASYMACDYYLKPLVAVPSLSARSDQVFNLHNEQDIADFFCLMSPKTPIFSLISSIIFKTDRFQAHVAQAQNFADTAYTHIYPLFAMLQEGAIVHYLATPQLLHRGNNSFLFQANDKKSFIGRDYAKRWCVDYEGYAKLAEMFSQPATKLALMNGIHQHIIRIRLTLPKGLIKTRLYSNAEYWKKLQHHMKKYGHIPFTMRLAGLIPAYWGRKLVKLLYIVAQQPSSQ